MAVSARVGVDHLGRLRAALDDVEAQLDDVTEWGTDLATVFARGGKVLVAGK